MLLNSTHLFFTALKKAVKNNMCNSMLNPVLSALFPYDDGAGTVWNMNREYDIYCLFVATKMSKYLCLFLSINFTCISLSSSLYAGIHPVYF